MPLVDLDLVCNGIFLYSGIISYQRIVMAYCNRGNPALTGNHKSIVFFQRDSYSETKSSVFSGLAKGSCVQYQYFMFNVDKTVVFCKTCIIFLSERLVISNHLRISLN